MKKILLPKILFVITLEDSLWWSSLCFIYKIRTLKHFIQLSV